MARFTTAGGEGSGAPGPQGPQGIQGEPGETPDLSSYAGDILPAEDNTYVLGNSENRWKSISIGEGTIFITDATLGTEVGLTIDNGIFFINGIAQAQLPDLAVTNLTFSDNTVQTTAYTGGSSADIADFVFTDDSEETGRSIISLPGDKGMTIAAGADSDLYLTAGDDLYIQTLGEGDDIHINAADDIRFSSANDLIDNSTTHYWRMNSDGRFELPGDGYISNPYAETSTPQTNVVTYYDNYLNDQSGLTQANAVYLPVDGNTLWFQDNSNIFTSPVTITFADSTTVQTVAIYDATSQGIPAVVFQWNDQDRTKTYAETFPLNISVDYNQINYGQSVIVLDPQDNGNDQKIIIDATAPNHIHIRAGGEIDQSNAELILGGEDTYVKVSDTDDSVTILANNININSYASPSSMNINTYSGATIQSNRTSVYSDENKVVAVLGDIEAAVGVGVNGEVTRWSPNFEATGLAFTGTGATYPTYNSHYVKNGRMVTFFIEIDMATVTNFGTGQYKTELPFAPLVGAMNHFQSWCLVDETANPDNVGHAILQADHLANTSVLDLHYIKQSGGANSPVMEALFKQGSPVTLTTATHIYINGTYITAE